MTARLTPYRDGPYLVRGEFELIDQEGEVIDARRGTVARAGPHGRLAR